MIKISVAGLCVEIDNKYPYIEFLARDYLTDKAPDISVCATDSEITEEKTKFGCQVTDGYSEAAVLYGKIADKLYKYDAFLMHGAVLSLDGGAYIFTAASGVGKTTHIKLWLEELGDRVQVLNGDKPIIRFVDGIPYASGTPWRGKEGYGKNEMAPVKAVAYINRAAENRAEPVNGEDTVTALMKQVYVPREREAAFKTFALLDKFISSVSFAEVYCNMDREAARVAYSVLCKKDSIG